MEPEAKYTLVGSAVLILLALLAASIMWLMASGQRRDVETYKIYFSRQSLEGLEARSDVRMKGIRVGAVTGFSFSSSRPGTVEVVIGIEPSTPVRQSTRAVVDRNLITGLSSIRLLNLDETSAALTQPPAGESHRVIAEGESQLQQFSETINQLAQRADETMRRINTTLSDTNEAAFAETLDNLRLVLKGANDTVPKLNSALVSVTAAATSLRSVGATVTGDVHRLANRYDAVGAETSTALRDVAGSVKQVGTQVAKLTDRADGLLADSSVELRVTAQQLRSAADAIGSTARKLGDPRAALLGPSDGNRGPGEERR
ncbi:MAG: MlaD family protein [Caldimonas sp.]